MVVSTLLQKGINHLNHNEDALIVTPINEDVQVIAVMDGCSSARDSHFASNLAQKILAKEIKDVANSENNDSVKGIGEGLLYNLFDQVKAVQQNVGLSDIELVTTISLAVVDVKSKNYWIGFSGDGIWMVDHKFHEEDQNNRPNFFAYHLALSPQQWIDYQVKTWEGSFEKRVILGTDGILKTRKQKDTGFYDPIDNLGLLSQNELPVFPDFLEKRWDKLVNHSQVLPFDDIALIWLEI